MALDPGLVVERAGEVAADRHAQGIGAVAGGAERPPEAGVRAVGDDHVAGPHRLGRRRRRVGRPRRSTRPSSTSGSTASAPGQSVGAGLRPPGRPPSRRGRGAAPRSRTSGKSGCSGHASSRVTPCAIERRPSKRWNSASAVGETHVVELADRAGREAVAAGLLAREALLLDDEDPVARRRRASTRPPRPRARRRRRARPNGRARHRRIACALVIAAARFARRGIVARRIDAVVHRVPHRRDRHDPSMGTRAQIA